MGDSAPQFWIGKVLTALYLFCYAENQINIYVQQCYKQALDKTSPALLRRHAPRTTEPSDSIHAKNHSESRLGTGGFFEGTSNLTGACATGERERGWRHRAGQAHRPVPPPSPRIGKCQRGDGCSVRQRPAEHHIRQQPSAALIRDGQRPVTEWRLHQFAGFEPTASPENW